MLTFLRRFTSAGSTLLTQTSSDESSSVEVDEACDFISIKPASKKRLSKWGDVPRLNFGDVGGVSYECILRGLEGIDEDGDVGVDELEDLRNGLEYGLWKLNRKFSSGTKVYT